MAKLFFIFLLIFSTSLYADTKIFDAAKAGDNKKIIQLLSQGINIDERDKHKWTPLFEAISWGKIETAKLLISKKASINISNDEGNTPLHLAAFLGHQEILKLLIKNNALINKKNNEGQAALHLAVIGKIEIVEYLLKKGAKQEKDKYGNTVLDLTGSDKIKELLKKYYKNC